MENFSGVWADLRSRLAAGGTIQAWGKARCYTGKQFEVVAVDATSITVAGARMRTPRRVSKGDFAKVYAVWSDYRAGVYPRGDMTSLSQNTTYILSLLHWREAGGEA